VLCGGVSPT